MRKRRLRERSSPSAAQAEIDEVIVVDDQSTDRTGAILAELAGARAEIESAAGGGTAGGLGGEELGGCR